MNVAEKRGKTRRGWIILVFLERVAARARVDYLSAILNTFIPQGSSEIKRTKQDTGGE